ncbi:MAG: transposase [Desulfobacterales bacterium]|nr:transposase [Desulfobacterales bacterium]
MPTPSIVKRTRIRLSQPSYEEGYSFSVTISTYDRYPWFQRYEELANLPVNLVRHMAQARAAKLYAWCAMPDHIHLLLQDRDIVDFVRLVKGKMTPKARSLEYGRRLWQRSFYDHGLRREEDLRDTALYIWWNPVRAGIVDDPLTYPWSGSEVWLDWRELLGRDKPRHYADKGYR